MCRGVRHPRYFPGCMQGVSVLNLKEMKRKDRQTDRQTVMTDISRQLKSHQYDKKVEYKDTT